MSSSTCDLNLLLVINTEAHVKQLQDSAQPIPQSIAILLASARRKEEKYNAKKLANRKSAYSSRERKKAKINAMAQDNVRLKRESLILKSLPDPVRHVAYVMWSILYISNNDALSFNVTGCSN